MFKANIKINGKPVPSYFHEGDYYIEGRKGSEYVLEFINDSNSRILVIPSVDGLSVFDGKPATEKSRGYIIDSHSTVEIPGWSLNNEKVAKFTFGDVDNSYSTYQAGNTNNNGVIGFKVFYEKEQVFMNPRNFTTLPLTVPNTGGIDFTKYLIDNNIYGHLYNNSITMTASSGNVAQNCVQEIGTEFGKEADFKVKEIPFEKGYFAKDIILYYDSLKGLKDRGVKINPVKTKPQAFVEIGCVPPKNWKSS